MALGCIGLNLSWTRLDGEQALAEGLREFEDTPYGPV